MSISLLTCSLSIKTKSPETFTSVGLFRKVMLILEKHTFSLRTRRFIMYACCCQICNKGTDIS